MRIVSPMVRQGVLVCGFAVSLAVVSAGSASAQGYGQPYPKPAYRAPPTRYEPSRRPIDQSPRDTLPEYRPPIWQGLYLGAHLGADFATSQNALTGGLHLGYNWQFDHIVAGFEIDGSGKSISATENFAGGRAEGSQDWLSSVRLRLGYATGGTLFYVTGGYAVGNFEVALSTPGASYKLNEALNGYVLGGGVEMKFSPNISGRIEALHYGFAENTYSFPIGTVKADVDYTTVRAGLTYHFN